MNDIRTLLDEYAAILIGLAVGAATHLGLLMLDGKRPTAREIVGYVLLLGMIGLVATVATKKLGIEDGDARALTTAVLAVAAREVAGFIQRRGWRTIAKAVGHEPEAPTPSPAPRAQPTIEELMARLDQIPAKGPNDGA